MSMNLKVIATEAIVTPRSGVNCLDVELAGIEIEEILDYASIDEAVDFYTVEKLLDRIGKDRVQDYFDLNPNED